MKSSNDIWYCYEYFITALIIEFNWLTDDRLSDDVISTERANNYVDICNFLSVGSRSTCSPRYR